VLRRFTQQKKLINGDSGTAAAACNAPDWCVSYYVVSREKSAPCDAASQENSLKQ